MLGQNNPKTFKLKGKTRNQYLTISVDGDQHAQNFIQKPVVNFLGLTTSSSSQQHVMVGNGEQLAWVILLFLLVLTYYQSMVYKWFQGFSCLRLLWTSITTWSDRRFSEIDFLQSVEAYATNKFHFGVLPPANEYN